MKKKFILILFTFVAFFSLIINTNAVTCTYKDESHTAAFNVILSSDGYTIAEVTKLVGFKTNLVYDEYVKNWDEGYSIYSLFTGREYYKINKKCPPVALVSWNLLTVEVFVADEGVVKDTLKEELKGYRLPGTDIYELDLVETEEEPKPTDSDAPTSCLDFSDKGEGECENNKYFACVWNESKYGGYCNVDKLQYVKCGDALDIPKEAPQIISLVINLFKIAAPIILILVGVINLLKALASSSEDEITKARKKLVKKIFPAIMVFFVISIVQFVIVKVADSSEEGSITACFKCFLNNDCGDSIYYKTNIYGIDICKYLNGTDFPNCGSETNTSSSSTTLGGGGGVNTPQLR